MKPTVKLELNKEQITQLQDVIRNDKKYRTIQRVQALLLRYKDVSVIDIAFALNVWSDTVYVWIRNYKKYGIESLYEKVGRGRKSMFKYIPKSHLQIKIPSPNKSRLL